jgi:hypothetical protein
LLGLRDKTVTITTRFVSAGTGPTATNRLLSSTGMATGGEIRGPGTGTSDTAGLFALSNNEHVWTAAEVAAAGGHGAMYAMRRSVLEGRGMADGGAVKQVPQMRRATAARSSGGGIHVENLIVKAFSDQFSIRQVQDELTLHGVA